ncbi:MAG TPA: hypothetical protein VLA90_11700 [Actinomycetota bacterium]|nr:hypothetical protein [Actinomycetota bacterium]
MAWLARRERRPVWGILAALLVAAIAAGAWFAVRARADATSAASARAELIARTELAPLLLQRDLGSPITGDRAGQLSAAIGESIVADGPVDGVRLFSPLGRILYAAQTEVIGTRPSYLRDLTFRVAGGDPQTLVRSGKLLTYVPVWLTPDGPVVVAELSQPLGPIVSEATGPWARYGAVAGVLLLGCLAMVAVTTRAPARRAAPTPLYAPTLRRVLDHPTSRDADPRRPALHALEDQREAAERKVRIVEENFHAVQKRLKEALAQVQELETRLAVTEKDHDTNDRDLPAMHDQVRLQAQRLHEADLENNALRQRMALRQRELDESRRMLQEMRLGSFAEMRARLEAADARVDSMERHVRRLEMEVASARASLDMDRRSDALRGVDEEDVEIEEVDELFEHPVIFRNVTNETTPRR